MPSTTRAETHVHPTSVALFLAAIHGARERAIVDAVDQRMDRMALKSQLRSVLKSLEPTKARVRRAG